MNGRDPVIGLSSTAAAARLKADGYNELPATERRGVLRILFEVVRQPMFALLIAGGVVYLLLGDRALMDVSAQQHEQRTPRERTPRPMHCPWPRCHPPKTVQGVGSSSQSHLGQLLARATRSAGAAGSGSGSAPSPGIVMVIDAPALACGASANPACQITTQSVASGPNPSSSGAYEFSSGELC
jgi:hypothetical protein